MNFLLSILLDISASDDDYPYLSIDLAREKRIP